MAASLATITAEFGFDYGPEFEISICEVLQAALPDHFGITRGFVTSSEGESEGDDIIVFDRKRFPTLHLRPAFNYARKEFVPVEAALCYIEAKHNLDISGDGGNSLQKACKQVEKVKRLVSLREPVKPGQVNQFLNINDVLGAEVVKPSPLLPATMINPMFCMIFARRVSKDGKLLEGADEIHQAMDGVELPDEYGPELIVLGEHNVVIPAFNEENITKYGSVFFIEGKSVPTEIRVPQRAFGVAILSLLAALEWIQLGPMPWYRLIGDALERK
jgi:hypothetical protein